MLQSQQILQNRYELKRSLGINFNRQTWLAEDLENKELVVVKCLVLAKESNGSNQWQYLKLFEREAQVLQQLDHDYIPQYRDYFAVSDRTLWFALVEEYIPGSSLAELLLEGKKFTEAQVQAIAFSILEILIYLHELNPPVLHRDIKPSNLIWHESSDEQNPEIYLVDFGAVQDKASAEGKTITVVGTYGYAPMEQFGGRAVAASDLYALGATLIHLLTGISPADLPQDDMRIEFSARTGASKKLVRWIEVLTNPNVKRRPPTARDALNILENNLSLDFSESKHLRFKYLKQPKASKIQLTSSGQKLIIKFPRKQFTTSPKLGMKYISLLLVMLLGMILLVSAFSSWISFGFTKNTDLSLLFLYLIIFTFVFGIWFRYIWYLLKYIFEWQLLLINLDSFVLENRLSSNFYHQQLTGKTNRIEDVFPSVQIDSSAGELDMITIQTWQKRYSFGIGASNQECRWVAQEIKEWLKQNSR